MFIEPGAPWQKAFVEPFNGKLRDELLAIEVFHTLLEAKVMAEDYRKSYNTYPLSLPGTENPLDIDAAQRSSFRSACRNSHKQ